MHGKLSLLQSMSEGQYETPSWNGSSFVLHRVVWGSHNLYYIAVPRGNQGVLVYPDRSFAIVQCWKDAIGQETRTETL